jgi:glycerate dehydrogenase
MSKIVVLDGHTTNPGDLDWGPLEQLGEVDIYERTPRDKILERLEGAEIALTNKVPLGAEVFDKLDALKFISVLATGFDIVDIDAASDYGIAVSNVPSYSSRSVAEHTFGLIFELTHRIGEHSSLVHDGAWSRSDDFTFWTQPLTEIADKTIGLIGFGRIGRKVGDAADAFGMKILAHTKSSSPSPDYGDFELVDRDRLLAESDIVSLHAPLNDETHHMLGAEEFEQMKKSALLINAGRGELTNEEALGHALRSGEIAGAGVDVASQEPIPEDFPLVGLDNCVLTPHIAWTTQEARQRLLNTTVENVEAFLDGAPINRVDNNG